MRTTRAPQRIRVTCAACGESFRTPPGAVLIAAAPAGQLEPAGPAEPARAGPVPVVIELPQLEPAPAPSEPAALEPAEPAPAALEPAEPAPAVAQAHGRKGGLSAARRYRTRIARV